MRVALAVLLVSLSTLPSAPTRFQTATAHGSGPIPTPLSPLDIEPLEVVTAGPPPLNMIQRRSASIVTVWRSLVKNEYVPHSSSVFIMMRPHHVKDATVDNSSPSGPRIQCKAGKRYVDAWGLEGDRLGTAELLQKVTLLVRTPEKRCYRTSSHKLQMLQEVFLIVPTDQTPPGKIEADREESWQGCHVLWDEHILHSANTMPKKLQMSDCTALESNTSKHTSLVSNVLNTAAMSAYISQHHLSKKSIKNSHSPSINMSHLSSHLDREYGKFRHEMKSEDDLQSRGATHEHFTSIPDAKVRHRRHLLEHKYSSKKTNSEEPDDLRMESVNATSHMTHEERQTLALLASDVQRKHNARDAYIMTGAFTRSLPTLIDKTVDSFALSSGRYSDVKSEDSNNPDTEGSSFMNKKELVAHHSRAVAIMLIEANARVTNLLNIGVQAKEVFAMVVDKIMQMLPEILIILISLLLKEPLTWLLSMVLSASMPFSLVPTALPFSLNFPGIKFKYGPRKKCDCHKFEDQARFRETSSVEIRSNLSNTTNRIFPLSREEISPDFRLSWNCSPAFGGRKCSVPLEPALCDIVGAGHVTTFNRLPDHGSPAQSVKTAKKFNFIGSPGEYFLVGAKHLVSEEIYGRMIVAEGYGKPEKTSNRAMVAVSIRLASGDHVSIENDRGTLKVFDSNCTQIGKQKGQSSHSVASSEYNVEQTARGNTVKLSTSSETRVLVHRSVLNTKWLNAFLIFSIPTTKVSPDENLQGERLGGVCSSRNKAEAKSFKSVDVGSRHFCLPVSDQMDGSVSIDSEGSTALPDQVFDAVSAGKICGRVKEQDARNHCLEDQIIAGVDAPTRMRLLTASLAESRQRQDARSDMEVVNHVVKDIYSLSVEAGFATPQNRMHSKEGILRKLHSSSTYLEHMSFLQEASNHFSNTMAKKGQEVLKSVQDAYETEQCRGICEADTSHKNNSEKTPSDTSFAETYAKLLDRSSIRKPNKDPIKMYQSESREEIRKVTETELVPRIADIIINELNKEIPSMQNEVFRGVTQDVTPALLERLTEMLVENLIGPLTRTLVRDSTTYMASSLTGGLTHSLASTITHSLKRSPKDDYYCALCKSHSLYCTMCRSSAIEAHNDDYYVAYYSAYYAEYASRYYSGPLKDIWLHQAWSEGPEPVNGKQNII